MSRVGLVWVVIVGACGDQMAPEPSLPTEPPCPEQHAQVGAWERVRDGLPHGLVRSVVALGGSYFAATEAGGVFRSDDAGTTWANAGLADTSVVTLAGDVASGALYAVVEREDAWTLEKSSDRGATWIRIIDAVHFDTRIHAASDVVYAESPQDLRVSRDGGVTWTSANVPGTGAEVALGNANAYAATSTGVFVQALGETSWTSIRDGAAVAIAHDGNDLFVGTYDGVYRTGNETTWAKVYDGVAGHIWAVGSTVWIFTATQTLRTTNRGMTWSSASAVIVGGDDARAFARDGWGNLLVSVDAGASWATDLRMAYSGVRQVVAGRATQYALGTVPFRSVDGGASWDVWPDAPGRMSSLYVDPDDPNRMIATLASSARAPLVITRDGGATWEPLGCPSCDTTYWQDPWTQEVFREPTSGTLYRRSSVWTWYRSTDRGDTWTEAWGQLPDGYGIDALAFKTGAPGVIYATASTGVYAEARDSAAYVSYDDGASWQRAVQLEGFGGSWIGAIDVATDGTVFIAGRYERNSIHRSIDAGATWTTPNDGLPTPAFATPLTSLAIDRANACEVYVAGSGGAYRSIDRGLTWQALLGLPVLRGYDWASVTATNDALYAATSRGLFRASLSR